MPEKSFIEKCVNNEADIFEIDKYSEYWHTHHLPVSLQGFLGMTDAEYERWTKSSDISVLEQIVQERRRIMLCKRPSR